MNGYLIKSFIFTCVVMFLSPIAEASQNEVVSGYDLDIKLIMEDGRIFQPSATLATGKEARLTFDSQLNNDSPIQLRLKATPRDKKTLFISAQVLELVESNWTILNEAKAAGYLGKTMSFDVGGDAYIEIKANKVDVDK